MNIKPFLNTSVQCWWISIIIFWGVAVDFVAVVDCLTVVFILVLLVKETDASWSYQKSTTTFVAGVGFRFFPCGFRLIGGGFRGFREFRLLARREIF